MSWDFDTEFKDYGLINLLEEVSRQLNVWSAAQMLLDAFRQIYIEYEKQKYSSFTRKGAPTQEDKKFWS